MQSEPRHFFRDKICRHQCILIFLVFVVLHEKINFKIRRPSDVGKSEKKPVQKGSNCNDESLPGESKSNIIMANLWLKLVEIYSNCRRENKYSEQISEELWDNSDCFLHRFTVGLHCLFMFQLYATHLQHKPPNCYWVVFFFSDCGNRLSVALYADARTTSNLPPFDVIQTD